MSFTAFTNVITVLFCVAVLVQSVRMMRSLNKVRESQLDRTVGALDTATAKARGVLSELKDTLTIEGTANARALAEAREIREELNVMVGIANAMAERLIEAASTGPREDAAPDADPAKPLKAAQPARPRSTTSRRPTAKPAAKPTKAKTAKTTKAAQPTGKTADASRETPAKTAPSRSARKTAKPVADVKETA